MISLFDEAWLMLNQAGRLLDRAAFESLPELSPPPRGLSERLRDAIAGSPGDTRGPAFGALLDAVLEGVCGLVVGWRKGNDVTARDAETLLDGTTLKPRRAYGAAPVSALHVFVSEATRIGQHKGRRDTAHVVEYLRRRKASLGLITNGREWRLIWADTDNTAFVEWTSDRFLDGDALTPALLVLRRMLSHKSLAPDESGSSCLLAAIKKARLGQASLSKELGERVRAAVELLLSARRPVIEPHWNADESKAVYDAACHFVMRLVVVFFAEARELLPVDSPVYHRGYGLKGLLEALERAGTDRRKTHRQAWPRLLALFRLLHRGSPHPSLIVPTYGGDLFRPHPLPPLPKGRGGALSLIEDMSQPPSDEVVYRMLTLLTRTTERLREGSATRTVAVPVDFTELTSEYIGILYEGLLDYELHRVGEEPVVFLSIGDQPALPLDRLEAMTDKQLQALVEKANVKGEASDDEEESSEDAEDVEDETSPHGPFSLKGEGESDDEPANLDDIHSAAMRRALAWAERAAIAAKLVRASKKNDPKHRTEIEKAAQQLIARVMLPGELYVVRWGGTRKGAGTFYTRPQLTLPTVRRTLEPLFFTPNPTSPPCPLSLSGEGENSEVFLAPCPFRERAGGEVGQVSITRHAHVSAEKLELARKMRQLPTETEARAWELLRDRRCLGLKFRRQQVIRGFIVDFYCAERRLAIELDGEVHASQQEYDQARDAALNAVGVSVVRIANHQLSKQHLETLLSSYLTPTSLSLKGEGAKDTFELSPSPEGRGGRGVRCEEARGVRSGELSYRTPKRSFRSRSAIQRWARALSSSLPCAC